MNFVDMVVLLVFLGIFVVLLAVYLLIRLVVVGRMDRVGTRLSSGSSGQSGPRKGSRIHEIRKSLVFGALTRPLASQIPQLEAESKVLSVELRRAGFYKPSARLEYLAVRNATIIGTILLFAAIISLRGPEASGTMTVVVVGFVMAAVAYSIPRLVISSIGKKRVAEIQRGLPDALDIVAMSMSGGLSLHDALDSVTREIRATHPALSFELDLVRQQTEMGSLDQALRQFAHRIDAPEIRQMAALITQSDRLGTNVVIALQDHADAIRQERRSRAEEQSSKANVKILFPLVFCMAPSVFILLWGPPMLQMREFYFKENQRGGALSQPSQMGGFDPTR